LIVISELLRPQQRIEEIDHHQRADRQHDGRFGVHSSPLPHALTEAHIANRNNKKCDRQYCENNVLHKLSPKTRFSANIAGTFLPLKTGNPPQ
jgi:hypothetical protein